MDDEIIQKFREKFLEEANMLLDKFEKDLLELETNPADKELNESVFRVMHTLKGISAMYGFDYISEYTHLLENIFQNLRDGKLLLSSEISEISLLSIDHIRALLADEKLQDSELKATHHSLIEKINQISETSEVDAPREIPQQQTPTKKKQSWYIIMNTNEQMYFRNISLVNICEDLLKLGELRIHRIPVLNADKCDSWGLLLVTDSSIDDILEVLMFIEDDCSVIRVLDQDILNSDLFTDNITSNIQSQKRNEPSILDLIEKEDFLDSNKILPHPILKSGTTKHQIPQRQTRRIMVDTIKLDNLMYLVSELITLNSQISEVTRKRDYEKQQDYVEKLNSLSKQFRSNALEIRLVPLSDIALRFQRLIRDLSNSLGKKIEFITEGIDTELDKNIIDSIVEPLMHLIRNCIDHGIEDPDSRKAMGKPETGMIKLAANYAGNNIVIRIEDDGNGIDIKKIHQKALEKGILQSSSNPHEEELLNFIFLPGFSTAKSLSEVSGRGVGMDIVKKRITDLRGTIAIETKVGIGTKFIIKLNQSMAITDTLLFTVEDSYFILPVSEIETCDEVEISEIQKRKHTSTIPYNKMLIPYVDLRKHLNLRGNYDANAKSIIVRNGNKILAIIADEIIGEHQAVLKPLNHTYTSETIITSVSQLGNGKIAFYIDTGVLYNQIAV